VCPEIRLTVINLLLIVNLGYSERICETCQMDTDNVSHSTPFETNVALA
jgi:hypothetical protein